MNKLTASNNAGYETPAGLTADVVVFTVKDGALSVLLHRRPEGPYKGRFALPGGFVGNAEDSAETAVRKLHEKTGMPPIYIEQLRFYDRLGRDPRGWIPVIAYLALVPAELLPEQTDNVHWQPVDELPTLAFDHETVIADGLDRLRGKLWYSNIAMGLLAEQFTLSDARVTYEAILGETYDAGDFARDLKRSGLIEATGESSRGSVGRPGALYRFISRQPTWIRRYGRRQGPVGAAS